MYRITTLACLHMNNLDQIICNDFKMRRINSVEHITNSTLFVYYKLFRLSLERDPPVNEVYIV